MGCLGLPNRIKISLLIFTNHFGDGYKAPPPRLETAVQSPSLDAIRQLAAALGCPVRAPLTDEDDDESDAP